MARVYRARDTTRSRDGVWRIMTVVLSCVTLSIPSGARAQPDDELIRQATISLEDELRDGATVSVEHADGRLRLVRLGTNGWVCQLRTRPTLFGQCSERQIRSVYLSVQGPNEQTIGNLRADELDVVLAGEPCSVVALDPLPPKMTIALLVETSNAVRGYLNPLRTGLDHFLDTLPPGHDVGFFTVAGQTRRRVDFTPDRAELRRQAQAIFPEGSSTALMDGLIETWERRFSPEDVWPVFVVVSQDRGGRGLTQGKYVDLVTGLMARSATVHSVLVSTGRVTSTKALLGEIAERTGGTFQVLAAPTALSNTLPTLAAKMGDDYEAAKQWRRVVYACTPDAVGDLRVRVSRRGTTVGLSVSRQIDR